jgi:tetratricopeptide repeat protein
VALVCYIALLVQASARPGPRLWGVHLIGFLPGPAAISIWCALFAALALAVAGAVILNRRAAAPDSQPEERRRALPPFLARWALPVFVVGSGVIFWTLRARTHFLGDGLAWIVGMKFGEMPEGSEPLAEALWTAVAHSVRSAGISVNAGAVAPFSVVCGLAAALAIWGIAREITSDSRHRFLPALLLLATLGSAALFFGYIESYPPVAVLVLAFVYAGLRAARTGSAPWLAGIVLVLGLASHLMLGYLVPAYLYLVLRNVRGVGKRAVYALAPGIAALGLMLALGFGPDRWRETVYTATRVLDPASSTPGAQLHPRDVRPYPILSPAHALDLGNLLLLVLPAPLLLLASRVLAGPSAPKPERSAAGTFLALCAASGFLVACVLELPVAPAQDWDLFSLLLIPLGVWAIRAGLRYLTEFGGALVTAAGVLVGAASLGSFVLVNANTAAGLARYSIVVGPGARITPLARAYGYDLLAHYYRGRGDSRSALRYAIELLRVEPTNPRYWAMVGAIHYGRGDYGNAIPFLEESERRGSQSAGTWTNLGISYAQTGRSAEALAQFRIAAAMEPDQPQNQLNLALSLLNAGRSDSARIVIQETVRRWPQFAPAQSVMRRHFGR